MELPVVVHGFVLSWFERWWLDIRIGSLSRQRNENYFGRGHVRNNTANASHAYPFAFRPRRGGQTAHNSLCRELLFELPVADVGHRSELPSRSTMRLGYR